jgi:alkylhydroperoxidase family enzyme
MRIGWATGAVYEWTQHWRVAKDLEIPDEDLLAVRDWKNSTILDETDKAVLQATDDAIEEGFITDTSWQKIKKMIPDEAQQIELVIAIGNWSLFSQLLKSLHIPLEEGTESWPPDGQVSPNA